MKKKVFFFLYQKGLQNKTMWQLYYTVTCIGADFPDLILHHLPTVMIFQTVFGGYRVFPVWLAVFLPWCLVCMNLRQLKIMTVAEL